MIKRIILKNIQRHKFLDLELSSGLNLVVGDNNRGKSSIIRGINWILRNRPLGNWMLRKGVSKCSAKAKIDDLSICRIKGKKENRYLINGDYCNDVAGKVPVETIKIGFVEIKAGRVSLYPNLGFSSEVEPLFMIGESVNIRYALLAYLTGVDKIEKALRKYKTKIRENNVRLGMLSEEKGQLEKEIKKLDPLIEIKSTVKEVIKKGEEMIRIDDTINFLQTLLDKTEEINKKIMHVKYILSALTKLGFNTLDLRIKETMNSSVIIDLLYSFIIIAEEMERTEFKMNAFQVKEKIESNFIKINECMEIRKKLNELIMILEEISGITGTFAEIKVKLEKFKNCPLCGSGR